MPLKIAIIGAGPAGCMLTRLIQQSKSDISVTIFENESGFDARSQGGSLDLHESTGLRAIKAANLFSEFQNHVRYDGESAKFCDKNLVVYFGTNGSSTKSTSGRPEIDRPRLRKLLYDSLEANTVVWNRKLERVDENNHIHFADGSVEKDFDLVVGADGAFSHVRPRVSKVKPFYVGLGGHTLRIPDAAKNHPDLHDIVNRGTAYCWAHQRLLIAQQMGDGSLNVYAWSARPENWMKASEYDIHDYKAVSEHLEDEYADWHPKLRAFTQVAEDDVVPRSLYMLPVGHRWEHVKGVTLIGDSAHLMTPFAGEGVNLAFADALELSKAIISAAQRIASEQASALDEKVQAFEEDMFRRSKPVQQLTADLMRLSIFEKDSFRGTIERYILTAMKDELGYWLTLLVTPLVYAYFAVFKMIW